MGLPLPTKPGALPLKQMDNKYKPTYRRITVTLFVMAVLGIAICSKAFYLKVVRGEYYREMMEKSYSQRHVKALAVRGDILARDGRKLACSVPNYLITMDPCTEGLPDSVFNRDIGKLSRQLSALFGDKSPDEYKKRICDARIKGRRYLELGNRRISHAERKQVEQFAIFCRGRNKGGFIPVQGDERKNPFGLLAARTIGKLYADKDKGGMVGLENSYNKELRGKDGINIQTRMTGRWVNVEGTPSENGRSLQTTIDIDIQDVAEYSLLNQLRAHDADHGVAILMEVKTGAIRAIVNLHRRSDGSYAEDYNYAIGELAEPGSTFKLASLMACLEEGKATLKDTIDTYEGEFKIYDRVMRDSKIGGHGNLTVKQAFEVSSNIGFSRLVMRCFDNNKKGYIERLKDMGLCDSLCVDIEGEKATDIKEPGDDDWSGTTLPWMSIGYEIRLTPLQLLTFYNAVANNGTMMRPMFVECQWENGKRVNVNKPHVMRNSIATSRSIKAAQEALKGVVEEGTARNIRNTPYKIAGKTGTAQIAKGSGGYGSGTERSYLASFAGYFPADNPLYSCVVMVYGPNNQFYYGNVVAGSVVKDIADRVYAAEFRKGTGKVTPVPPSSGVMPYSKGGWAPDLLKSIKSLDIPCSAYSSGSSNWTSTQAKPEGISITPRYFPEGIVPNVFGMGATDAVSLLEGMGLRVTLSGVGRVVSQSPSAGSSFVKGQVVSLSLSDD